MSGYLNLLEVFFQIFLRNFANQIAVFILGFGTQEISKMYLITHDSDPGDVTYNAIKRLISLKAICHI